MTQNTQANVVDGFVREADGTVKVTVATFNVGTYALFSTIGANGLGSGGVLGSIMSVALTSVSTQGDIDGFMNIVESALSKMTDSAAAIGALQIRVELQDKYSSKLSDAIEAGVSRLIDADMEEESARLSAVQTQQQLAIQSLSIANSSSQNLLSLFRQ